MPSAISIKFGPRAKSSAVSEYSRMILSDIMKAAKEADCLVTSTQRSPADQARAMYDNIVFYGVASQLALYGPNGQAVVRKYEELKKLGKTAEQIKAGMTQKIIELGPDKVSRHCADPLKVNVFDIDPNSIANRQAFEQAVKLDKRVTKFLQPPDDPAYHLEIPQQSQPGTPTIAVAAHANASVERLELTKEQLKKIDDNRQVFENAQVHTGVPWQALAAIWTRESFSVAPPERPGGQFQFDPVPSNKQLTNLLRRFSNFTEAEIAKLVQNGVAVFEAGAIFCACFLRMKVAPKITPDSPDDVIKEAIWAYNGRAYGGADKSPYVMNGFDSQHMNMTIRGTLPNPNGKGRIKVVVVDKRPGAFTVYHQLKQLG